MDLAGQQIFDFLSHYGYWMMLPLMIIEGPIITIIASMLAKLGAFNIFIVFILSVAGDMIGDIILYYLGYKLGNSFVGISRKNVGRYSKRKTKNSRSDF